MKADGDGVRDEVGFLALHQAFADRFFPGTSVLHTRLRYALFVPWLMAHSLGEPERLKSSEQILTGQLKRRSDDEEGDDKDGVIGGRYWPTPPAQPASMIYWTALSRWKILQPRVDGVSSSRSDILKRIGSMHGLAASVPQGDDGEPVIDVDVASFIKLPSPPSGFLKEGKRMDFSLTEPERKFLRRQLICVPRGAESNQSFLARIAEAGLPEGRVPNAWHKSVSKFADAQDRDVLKIAKHSAALAGIGRAVYAALVEEAKTRDGFSRTTRHRDDVKRLVEQCGDDAKAFDSLALTTMFPDLPRNLVEVLRTTHAWLLKGNHRVSGLADVYRIAELARKDTRARLDTRVSGSRRRAEWSAEKHPLAAPLHFRWGNVVRLLTDLNAP